MKHRRFYRAALFIRLLVHLPMEILSELTKFETHLIHCAYIKTKSQKFECCHSCHQVYELKKGEIFSALTDGYQEFLHWLELIQNDLINANEGGEMYK